MPWMPQHALDRWDQDLGGGRGAAGGPTRGVGGGPREPPRPSDCGDTQGIVRLSTTLLEQAQHQRFLLERDQYRNILYYLGIQWVTFDERLRTWIPQTPTRWGARPR